MSNHVTRLDLSASMPSAKPFAPGSSLGTFRRLQRVSDESKGAKSAGGGRWRRPDPIRNSESSFETKPFSPSTILIIFAIRCILGTGNDCIRSTTKMFSHTFYYAPEKLLSIVTIGDKRFSLPLFLLINSTTMTCFVLISRDFGSAWNEKSKNE